VTPVEVTELKAKAEADLRAAEGRYEVARSRALAAQADEEAEMANLTKMKAVWDWVQGQDQPEKSSPPATAQTTRQDLADTPTRFGRPIPEVSTTELCFRALESFGRAVSAKQIRERLAADGHEFTQTQVRGALKYLSTKKPPLVETSIGSGVWRLTKAAKAVTPTSFTPTKFVAGVSTTGVNGSATQDGAVPPERG
jgi:hypothetical protein